MISPSNQVSCVFTCTQEAWLLGEITPQEEESNISTLCTCVCFCSSFSCGFRDGCLRMRRRQLSEALGLAASSPHLPCPLGSARSLGSGDLERRRFLCRCLPHLTTRYRCKKNNQQQRNYPKDAWPEHFTTTTTTTHVFHSCVPVAHQVHIPPANKNRECRCVRFFVVGSKRATDTFWEKVK